MPVDFVYSFAYYQRIKNKRGLLIMNKNGEVYVRELRQDDKSDDMRTNMRIGLFSDKSNWKVDIDPYVVCWPDGVVIDVQMTKVDAESVAAQLNTIIQEP